MRERMIEAARALCALEGIQPRKMVVVGDGVIIQTKWSSYYRLKKNGLWARWEFEGAGFVSVDEMNALAASGALDDLLPAPPKREAIGAGERKRWWQ